MRYEHAFASRIPEELTRKLKSPISTLRLLKDAHFFLGYHLLMQGSLSNGVFFPAEDAFKVISLYPVLH